MAVQPAQIGIPSGTTSYSDAEINAILATIRSQESGSPAGNYTVITSGGSDACGAYQYISSTWQNTFDAALAAGYLPAGTQKTARACQAPPAVQDAVARYDVITFLNSVGGDVSQIPKHWYYPVSVGNHRYDGFIPPGNTITIGAYQAEWMKTFANISKDPALAKTTGTFSGTAQLTGFNPLQTLLQPAGFTLANFLGLHNIANEFVYLGEVVGGFLLIVLGVIVVLVDTGTLSKMPMPVPIPV